MKETKKLIIVSGESNPNISEYNELIKLLVDNGCTLKSDDIKDGGKKSWEFEQEINIIPKNDNTDDENGGILSL